EDSRTPFRDVEIDLENAAFGPDELDPVGERDLQELAQVASRRPEKEVLHNLHGDGAAAARNALARALDGISELAPVDAVVPAEAGVLGRDHRLSEKRRDAIKRHPALIARHSAEA